MIDLGTWTKKAASVYRNDHAAAVPIRAAWLAREAAASGAAAEALDGPGGLGALWAWTTRRFDEEGATGLALREPLPADDPQAGPRPPWHTPDSASTHLSDGALWLIEGLGCHLAALVVAACPDAHWDVYRAPTSTRDVNQNRTMLHGLAGGGRSDPSRMVYGEVIGTVIHGDPWPPDALGALHAFLISGA